ncbi:hypothetical protein FC692_28900 [Bacillus cereus]|uniref:hypothetical protein n=1 Tax=Bacillus cereus TaxID=1396 RepID=UPI0010BF34CA|nr:hypothetical protein [Bacillus cereus]TKH20433.1 hypothetical protein FC692_28900 [Bacillus cereus]
MEVFLYKKILKKILSFLEPVLMFLGNALLYGLVAYILVEASTKISVNLFMCVTTMILFGLLERLFDGKFVPYVVSKFKHKFNKKIWGKLISVFLSALVIYVVCLLVSFIYIFANYFSGVRVY